jgi:plasmid stabilization system protein ParE
MKQIYWTNFALSELKNIFLYHQMVAGKRVANKIKKSIFSSTKKLNKQPLIGAIEENLKDLNQGHRYLVEGNYKIIYLIINESIFITDVFDCRQNPEKMKK